MLFNRKVRRLIDPDKTDKALKEDPLELEKGDKKAIVLAAFLVYGPVVLGMSIVLGLIAWLLLYS